MKVWDLPTRLFHWLIAMVIGFSWWSASAGEMEWHYRSGQAALLLLMFRIFWGFIGSSTARFARFLRSPLAAYAYMRRPGDAPVVAGHSPLAGYSVLAMLLALAIQVGSGLFAVDFDGLESGPLAHLISFEQGRFAAEVHETSFIFLQILICLHLLAILYYRIRGRKLTWPMVTGRDYQVTVAGFNLNGGGLYRAFATLLISLAVSFLIFSDVLHRF